MERCEALKSANSLEFWRNDDPKCPHCGAVVSVIENELWALYEEGEHDIDCDECGLPFKVSTNVTYSFSTDEQEDDDEQEATRDAGSGEERS